GSAAGQTVTIAGSDIASNLATGSGGGIYCTQNPFGVPMNTLSVTESNLYLNSADEGGAIYTDFTNVSIDSSSIHNNVASNIGVGGGGGVHFRSSIVGGATFDMNNSTVSGNTARQDGGG